MAVPFRKVSKTRKRMRRAHNALTANGTTKCPSCGAIIRPHRVCTSCGKYKNNEVIKNEEKKEEVKKAPKKEAKAKEVKTPKKEK